MYPSPLFRVCRYVVSFTALAVSGGCGSLLPKPPPQPAFYALDSGQPGADVAAFPSGASMAVPASKHTLIIGAPQAAAGFDSARIIYLREPHHLEYFAHSQWVDTPARMLSPLLVAALGRHAAFRAVVQAPSAAIGDLRLDTEILRLQHDFSSSPSRVRFTLRATLLDAANGRVIAWRDFDQTVPSSTEDAQGGVVAAHRAIEQVIAELGRFCIAAAGG